MVQGDDKNVTTKQNHQLSVTEIPGIKLTRNALARKQFMHTVAHLRISNTSGGVDTH